MTVSRDVHSPLVGKAHGSAWSPAEIERAKTLRLIDRKPVAEIAAELGRTAATVYTQLRKHGVTIEEHRRWTDAARDELVEHVRLHGLAHAAAAFGLGVSGAAYQLKQAGHSVSSLRPRRPQPVAAKAPPAPKPARQPRPPKPKTTSARNWSPDEDATLRAVAATRVGTLAPGYSDISSHLPGRSKEAVRIRLRLLGIAVGRQRSQREAAVVTAITDGLHQSEIVRRTGAQHRTVLAIAAKHGLAISQFAAPLRPAAGARPVADRAPRPPVERAPRPAAPPAAVRSGRTEVIDRGTAPAARAPATSGQPATAPATAHRHRTSKSTFNTWRLRDIGKVARDASLDEAIAAHIAANGVTRPAQPAHETALNSLRRRGYIVTRDGPDVVIDHRHRLSDSAAIIAFAQARGLA